jgi:diguanylate cyclase (GGDEF)-like protein
MELLSRLGLATDALFGRTVLITGAARGIGAETARTMAALGATVVLVDIRATGPEVAEAITATGGSAHFVQADLARTDEIPAVVDRVIRAHGPVDMLINSAARLRVGPAALQPVEFWDEAFRTNLLAPVLVAQCLLPDMLARKRGTVISLISIEGIPLLGSYCAAKVGLRSAMMSMGREVPGDQGVSVFSMVPGSVETPLVHELADSMAAYFNMTKAEVLASFANNQGYSGLIPVEHTAAALAWYAVNGAQFHGQVLDGLLPFRRAGIITRDGVPAEADTPVRPVDRIPSPEHEMDALVRINRGREHGIEERTRELRQVAAELEARTKALEAANHQLQAHSQTDALTGLWNRRYVESTVPQLVQQLHCPDHAAAHDGDAQLVVVVLDLDGFKRVNDLHGHHAGDEVLRQVADLLRSLIRNSDTVARWGGEEFLLLLYVKERAQAGAAVERIRRAVADHPITLPDGTMIRVTCSLGFAPLPAGDLGPVLLWERAMDMADKCLYAAKRAGRDAWVGVRLVPGATLPHDEPFAVKSIPQLVAAGVLELETSVPDHRALVWSAT